MSSSANRGLGVMLSLGLAGCWLATDFDRFTKGGATAAGTDGGGVSPRDDSGVATSIDGGTSEGGAVPVCDAAKTNDDAKNCGRCGHDCLGGACQGGKCQPVVLVDGDIQNPNGVAYSSAGLYIGGDRGLFFLAPGATRAKKIAGPSAPQFLTATATDVFFADYDNGSIAKVAIGTEEVTTIKSGIAKIEGIAVSPDFIYVARDQASVVERLPFTTSPSNEPLAALSGSYPNANGLDWSNGVVYVALFDKNQVIAADEKDVTTSRILSVTKGCDPYGVKVDGPDAFVTCQDEGSIRRVSIDGQSAAETLVTGLRDPAGLAVTPTAIYWAEEQGGVQMVAR